MTRRFSLVTSVLAFGMLFIFLGLVLSGCAAKDKNAKDDEVVLEWPSPPHAPMVRWVRAFHDPGDAGIKPGFWRSLGGFLFGERQQRIVKPYGIHLDTLGRLSVVDPGASVVHLLNFDTGSYSAVSDTEEGRLISPIGVTSDERGVLYLTDSTTGTVYRYDEDKAVFVAFSSGVLQRPTGIVFNRNNWLLYVSDTAAHQVVAFGLDGQERFRFGGRGTALGQLNFPTDLSINHAGNIVVTDSMNARIQVFSAAGHPLHKFGERGYAAGYFDKPKGVALDSDGHVYVCDAMKDTVQVYSSDGRYLFQFGDRGQGAGQFWMPSGVHIAADDKVYVADSYNQRIQVFQYLKQ